ncbi:MAG: Zn-dependent alcohol dehydrogenase [Acidiferrobacterales bacterium]|nr:Zn-dependent alcohol dehydrogenase [Acidiferrobacterales bacterium]
MKAAVSYNFGKPLVIDEIKIDDPRKDEIKIKVTACAICHSDILYMDGAWGGRLPTVYGHEAAGTVEACGPGVTKVRPGDKVIVSLVRHCGGCFFCDHNQHTLCEHEFATDEPRRLQASNGIDIHRGLRTGCFAEYAVVHQSQVVAIPDEMDYASASLLACGVITGFGAVMNTAAVKPGTHVVVIGAGGVGINCIQAARIASAATVTAIDINPDRLATAKRFGATHTVDSSKSDAEDSIRQVTAGRGADYVFVATGHPEAVTGVFRFLRLGGTLILVGMPAEGSKFSMETVDFIDANQSILGCKMGNPDLDSDIPKLIGLYQSGELELDALVTGRFPLENINDAIESTRQGVGIRNVVMM